MAIRNDHEAWILASVYNFCPARVVVPDHTENLDSGKYEPDDNPFTETRFMILAQTIDATNILVKYTPAELPP